MRRTTVVLLSVMVVLSSTSASTRNALPVAAANSNRSAAGVLRNGVLTVSLDAMVTTWYPNGDSLAGMTVEAFAERRKQPSVPGPLIRVPRGTEIRASIHNSLTHDTLTVHIPATVHGAESEPDDSVAVRQVRLVSFAFARPRLGTTSIAARPARRSASSRECADCSSAHSSWLRQP